MAKRQTAIEKTIQKFNEKIEALTFARDQLVAERAAVPKRTSKSRPAAGNQA